MPRGKVRPADKLQLKAATILPLLDSPDFSKTQSTVGTMLVLTLNIESASVRSAGIGRRMVFLRSAGTWAGDGLEGRVKFLCATDPQQCEFQLAALGTVQ